MTDKQRLAKLIAAEKAAKRTTQGYTPGGVHWREFQRLIDEVEESLRPPAKPPVPNLGPIWQGGKSVLLHQLTHNTDGVPGYPAFDDGWAAGRVVIAPEAWEVTKDSGAQGGDACFLKGDSGLLYWVGHIVRAPAVGSRFAKGARLSTIFDQGRDKSHVHLGIDARPLTGKALRYGANGNGPDYTYGKTPTVGVQLKAAL